jgi:hypothetical protein
MRTTERNWSAIVDYKMNGRLVSFLTRQEWIRQCLEWYDESGHTDAREDYERELNAMEDWELMDDIQDTWGVEIIETTWLKVGNECAWYRREGNFVVKILEIPDGELTGWSPIGVECNGILYVLPLNNLYGLTGEKCPRCGAPLYVSDLCRFNYVCLECDENFD